MAPKDTFFRSVDMSLIQLYIANENGREVVKALGELGQVQFRDLNQDSNALKRTFTGDILRLNEVERQLHYIRSQLDKADITLQPSSECSDTSAANLTSEIDELMGRIQCLEQQISSLSESYENLVRRELELVEWHWVLSTAGSYFEHAQGHGEEIYRSLSNAETPLLRDIEQQARLNDVGVPHRLQDMSIGIIAGMIPRTRMGLLQRTLWRTLRGNLYMNQSDILVPIVDPTNNEEIHKSAFMILAHGKSITAKIRQISKSLGASLYSVDEDYDLRREQMHEVSTRLNDTRNVVERTKNMLHAELTQIAPFLTAWMTIIKKERAIYDTLNQFTYDQARTTHIAEAWCPTSSLPSIKMALRDVNDRAGLTVPTIVNRVRTNNTPPTFVRTNKFTDGFQNIVNAYNIPKYEESNPGLYTAVTFPFMFAVMFGDVGHGALITIAATAMICWEGTLKKSQLDELVQMAFYGRYTLLMMGLFSIYTGLLYNDVFSKSFTFFPSQWKWPDNIRPSETIEASLRDGYRFPFGVDWNWHDAENYLLFTNSMKMKMSILLGWMHMTYALCLQYVNAHHFRQKVDIIGNFIPEMIFFQSIFGYLAFTVLYKWSVDWESREQSPPNLLNMLISMLLSPGKVQEQLYEGQAVVQVILLFLAFIQIPIMLFFKPLYLRWENNNARTVGRRAFEERSRESVLGEDRFLGEHVSGSRDHIADENESAALSAQSIAEEECFVFNFDDLMIYQVIHTIEFCLNSISHTASYLRLWALSLAHQQLSIVLWDRTIGGAFKIESFTSRVIMIIVTFYLWFTITICILCVMEGSSAMLHSLRLHWIEAMSKHFIGGGTPFTPFDFKRLLAEDSGIY
ncbi:vacuolar ATPase 98 kDa subunit [Aspergillus pseudotamarii]|uniref:V-type proton ATPase subunit a n=1 Tax=Aspergillus pseudotamarii TaxID=132259 RepID=A0A5N6S935_ASPPS|nr:vacuolar ATPase 98 kDa subunit [Aspergillus pseudotamarii]KAE8131198.1 vacuolar ATPase 98 kDa subunit [Aspergillus pseudotamarii]